MGVETFLILRKKAKKGKKRKIKYLALEWSSICYSTYQSLSNSFDFGNFLQFLPRKTKTAKKTNNIKPKIGHCCKSLFNRKHLLTKSQKICQTVLTFFIIILRPRPDCRRRIYNITPHQAVSHGRRKILNFNSREMTSGYSSLLERLCPGGVQRRSDEMTSSLAQ